MVAHRDRRVRAVAPTGTQPAVLRSARPQQKAPAVNYRNQLQSQLTRTIPNATLELTPLPLAPTLSLLLISATYPRGRLDDDVARAILAAPAYWAFCWAAGRRWWLARG